MEQIYYGETQCQGTFKSGPRKGKQCSNNAYYSKDNFYLCGVHNKGDKIKLPINPKKKENKEQQLKDDETFVEEYALSNLNSNKVGKITVAKLKMMKQPDKIEGYLKVFPNFKHQNRSDGFGCASLSPKSLGPVDHGMPDLPIALNIENYHQ